MKRSFSVTRRWDTGLFANVWLKPSEPATKGWRKILTAFLSGFTPSAVRSATLWLPLVGLVRPRASASAC
jgi:hypothetical protein